MVAVSLLEMRDKAQPSNVIPASPQEWGRREILWLQLALCDLGLHSEHALLGTGYSQHPVPTPQLPTDQPPGATCG